MGFLLAAGTAGPAWRSGTRRTSAWGNGNPRQVLPGPAAAAAAVAPPAGQSGRSVAARRMQPWTGNAAVARRSPRPAMRTETRHGSCFDGIRDVAG
uniref:Uncharacterized protein n=1 Tax=Anopheles atroparvus TaxID=41427 RepID=A0AAG5CN49_ANOAO